MRDPRSARPRWGAGRHRLIYVAAYVVLPCAPCLASVTLGPRAPTLFDAGGSLTRTTEGSATDGLTVRWTSRLRIDSAPLANATAQLEVAPGSVALRRTPDVRGPASQGSVALGVDPSSVSGQLRWRLREHEVRASRSAPRFSSLQRQLVDGAFAAWQPADQFAIASRIASQASSRYVYARPLDGKVGAHLAEVAFEGVETGRIEVAAFQMKGRDRGSREQGAFGGSWSMPEAPVPVSLAYVERRLARTSERAISVAASPEGWSTSVRLNAIADPQRVQPFFSTVLAVSKGGPRGEWSLAMKGARVANCENLASRERATCAANAERSVMLRFSASL